MELKYFGFRYYIIHCTTLFYVSSIWNGKKSIFLPSRNTTENKRIWEKKKEGKIISIHIIADHADTLKFALTEKKNHNYILEQ